MSIPVLEDPVAALLERLRAAHGRWIVGLAGVPGSGKTTYAARVAAEVERAAGPGKIIVLGMDGFHLSKAELAKLPASAQAFARRGAPWTFDRDRLAQRLELLRTSFGREVVPWPDFQHEVGDPVEGAHQVPTGVPLILVEGIYLLHRDDGWNRVTDQLDQRWYLDTPLDVAMQRLAQRHMAAWGMTIEQAQARVNGNDRLNSVWIERSREHADYLIRV